MRLELAIIGFCAWQASGLLTAWRNSPFDRWGWLAFAIWLTPAVAAVARKSGRPVDSAPVSFLALMLALLGRILDLNALLCCALGLAVGALVPPAPRSIIWLLGGIAWMPALGWLARDLPVTGVAFARVSLALVASGVALLPNRGIRAL